MRDGFTDPRPPDKSLYGLFMTTLVPVYLVQVERSLFGFALPAPFPRACDGLPSRSAVPRENQACIEVDEITDVISFINRE